MGDLSISVCRELPLFCSYIENMYVDLFNQVPTDRHFGCFQLYNYNVAASDFEYVSLSVGFGVLHSYPWCAR